MDWREEPIGRHHGRKSFDCGAADLNEYLARYARQNHESGGAKTFVAVSPAEPARIRFGAQHLSDDPLKLILPLSVIADAITGVRNRRK